MMKYNVERPHQGDRWYNTKDIREAYENDVKHLVASGVLSPLKAVDGKPKEVAPNPSEAPHEVDQDKNNKSAKKP